MPGYGGYYSGYGDKNWRDYPMPPRKLPLPPLPPHCQHKPGWSSYLAPCFLCDRYCNCNLTGKFEDVIVRSLDRQTIRLSSVVVRGSVTLQRMVSNLKAKLAKQTVKKTGQQACDDSGFFEGEIIDLEDDDEDFCDILDLIRYDNYVIDLREGEDVTLGVSAKTLILIQKYMTFHLDQVDLAVDEERRAEMFFASSMFPRPPKPPVNYFKYEEWEETFFDVDGLTFMDLMQARDKLFMWDLHFGIEKWLMLFRGTPNVSDFGSGFYFLEPSSKDDESGCEDFRDKKVRNPRRKSNHGKPRKFFTIQRKSQFQKKKYWQRY